MTRTVYIDDQVAHDESNVNQLLRTMDRDSTSHRNGRALSRRTTDDNARRRDLRLGFLIHDVSRMRRSAFDNFMRPLGITRTQWWVIAHLSRQDGMTQIQLADVLDVGKASLGNVIDRLEAAGLVERRSDPIDRRANRLFMTRKACQMIDKMQAAECDFNDQSLRRLSDTERDELVRLLSLIRSDLTDLQRDAGEPDTNRETSGRSGKSPRPDPRRRRRATSRA
jgi:MarR family transcriptional regulator, transcriptional regulator for hemolysin